MKPKDAKPLNFPFWRKGGSKIFIKPEVELSEIQNEAQVGSFTQINPTPPSSASGNLKIQSESRRGEPLSLSPNGNFYHPETSPPVYNALSHNSSESGETDSYGTAPLQKFYEPSPLDKFDADESEDLFTVQKYGQDRHCLHYVLGIGTIVLGLVLVFGLAYTFLGSKTENYDPKVQNSKGDDTFQYLTGIDTDSFQIGRSDEDMDGNLKIKIHSEPDVGGGVPSFPIPDLTTRILSDFTAELEGEASSIISDGRGASFQSNGSSHGSSLFNIPPAANGTVLTEGIREGQESLIARRKTEERIRKLGLINEVENRSETLNQFFRVGSSTWVSREEAAQLHQLSLIGFSMDRASRIIAKRLNLTKEEAEGGIILDGETKIEPSPWCAAQIAQSVGSGCNGTLEYRDPLGRCNNINHQQWGSAFERYRRILLPQFDDGISAVRKSSHEAQPLPNPIEISNAMFSYTETKEGARGPVSMLFPMWAEFIEKDMDQTVPASGERNAKIFCCENGKLLEIQHPECLPISLSLEDEQVYEKKVRNHCLSYVRSAAAPSCSFGPREQFNLNTAFIDGSTIYTSSISGMNRVRSELKNEESGTLNIIWKKRHNFITSRLARLNPHWDGRRLFEETRRILIAEIQHITFNEYLPLLFGPSLFRSAGLKVMDTGYYEGYDKSVDPGISNVFSSAASNFRFSMVRNVNEETTDDSNGTDSHEANDMSQNPFLPLRNSSIIESLIRHYAFSPAGLADTTFSNKISSSSYFENGALVQTGYEMVAILIQKGRDHGIRPYSHWRKVCGLKEIEKFSDLGGSWGDGDIEKAQRVYASVGDIDLFVGGMAEVPVGGSLVGPTFSCLLADQFSRIRKGDRFWYEGDIQLKPFTLSQLRTIKTVSLGAILCSITESLGAIQSQVLNLVSNQNPIVPCSKILASVSFNYSSWKEPKPVQGIQIYLDDIILPSSTNIPPGPPLN